MYSNPDPYSALELAALHRAEVMRGARHRWPLVRAQRTPKDDMQALVDAHFVRRQLGLKRGA